MHEHTRFTRTQAALLLDGAPYVRRSFELAHADAQALGAPEMDVVDFVIALTSPGFPHEGWERSLSEGYCKRPGEDETRFIQRNPFIAIAWLVSEDEDGTQPSYTAEEFERLCQGWLRGEPILDPGEEEE